MIQFIFSTSHVHAYFMHTNSFIPISRLWLCSISFSLSLSLSQIDYTWHLSANLLRLGMLLVLGLLSHSGMGISLWDTLEMSYRVYTGVLIQYTWYRYLYSSICHDIQRYIYRSHCRSYIQDTTCLEGIVSWLPRLSVSEDCPKMSFCLISVRHLLCRVSVKHPMLGLCKRSKIP